MIFTVGIPSKKYKEVSVQEVYDYFKSHKSIQYDSETSGFSCRSDKMLCFQIGDHFNQYVIHPSYLQDFKRMLEEKELIGQNIRFDLGFLYVNGIFPKKVWDTYLAEGVLFCGIKLHKKNLAAIALRCVNIQIDKSVREGIYEKGLTDQVIEYSANDVKYLELIRDVQEKELKAKDLEKALEIENRFVLCLAYIEYCGFKLDKERWKAKILKDREKFDLALKKLNDYVIENGHNEFIEKQLDLFSSEPRVSINWASQKQVIPLFKKLGINTTIIEKGEKKETIEATHLSSQMNKFDILPLYTSYKESEKVISTYGQSFLEHINPVTEKIHTNFQQILNTGRVSSGGNGTPNMQNIPNNKETRACFIAEEGNTLIIADYKSQEIVCLTNRSLDPGLLEFFDKGFEDAHSFNAQKIWPELADLSLEEIKENHGDKRQYAKIGSFCLSYGGTSKAIADQLNISLEEGEKFYKAYFEAFPGLKSYFEKGIKDSLDNGFILLSEITGRKSYVYNYEEYKSLQKEIDRNFWDRYKILKKKKEEGYITQEFLEMKDKISKFFKIKGDMQRASQNYPIQSQSAEITKLACIQIFDFITDNNLLDIVKFNGVYHDEVVIECPLDMADTIKTVVKDCMEDAGKPYCPRVPLKTDAFTSFHWKK